MSCVQQTESHKMPYHHHNQQATAASPPLQHPLESLTRQEE
uniref:Uncharacterized protein n=1 Tax=Arundo donax TaxID=35708 RepID=A0A0A9BFD6_ARUDO